jgi:hypothetical protein
MLSLPPNRSLILSRRSVLIAASTLPFARGALAAPSSEPVGSVTSSVGSAFLARAADKIAATEGASILLGDTLETGDASRLALRLGAGTEIKLGAKATLKIDRFVAGVAAKLRMGQGAFLVDHGPGSEPDFDVETPYGLIAARGTKFWGGITDGVYGVYVIEGMVELISGDKKVLCHPGMGTNLKAEAGATAHSAQEGGIPMMEAHPWPEKRVQAAMRMMM